LRVEPAMTEISEGGLRVKPAMTVWVKARNAKGRSFPHSVIAAFEPQSDVKWASSLLMVALS